MSKNKNTYKVNESAETYGQPLTFEKVWLMFQETDKRLDKKFQETDKKISKISQLIGNIGNNNADVAESFFYSGLSGTLKLGRYSFDYIDRNITRRKQRIESEYDIILYNVEKVVIIEVKYKLHSDDITRFIENKLSKFRFLYQEYNNHKLYGGVAAFDIPKHSLELARQNKLFVLRQDGKNITLDNEDDFIPQEF